METTNKIKAILNSEKLGNAFYNLYDRWLDECKYEDINDYGKALNKVIVSEFPNYGVKLVSSTKRPFGIKLEMDGKKFHVYVKIEKGYIKLCAKYE